MPEVSGLRIYFTENVCIKNHRKYKILHVSVFQKNKKHLAKEEILIIFVIIIKKIHII